MTKASNTGGRTAPSKRGRKQAESNEEAELQREEEPTAKKTKTARPNSKRAANTATGEAQPALAAPSATEGETTKSKKPKAAPSLLMILPFDIQTEIFKHIPPHDLMTAMKVCSSFRSALSDPAIDRQVWRAALEAKEAPPIPEGWTAKDWAALFYGTRCQNKSCSTKDDIIPDYHVLRRLCPECKKQIYRSAEQISSINFGDFPADQVMELTAFSPLSPGYGYRDRPAWAQRHAGKSEEQFWVIDDVKETAKLLAQVKQGGSQQLEDFITERKTQLDEGKTRAVSCYEWHDQLLSDFWRIAGSRKRFAEQKLKALGFSKEAAEHSLDCNKAATKRLIELNDDDWVLYEADFVAKAEEYKRLKVQESRKKVFAGVYRKYITALPFHRWSHLPTLADVVKIPEVFAILDSHITVPDIEASAFEHLSLSDLLEKRENEIKALMLDEMIKNGICTVQQAKTKPDEQLSRLYAVFECGDDKCRAIMYGWEEVCTHRCRFTKNSRTTEVLPSSTEAAHLMTVPGPTPLIKYAENAKEVLSLLPKWRKVVKGIPDIDPKAAKFADMDSAAPPVVCSAEGCGVDPPQVFNWRQFVSHRLEKHREQDDATPSPTESTETVDAFTKDLSKWRCGHCSITFTYTYHQVLRHLITSHRIHEPKELVDLYFWDRFTSRNRYPEPPVKRDY